MAENADRITRQALGRTASLGDLYDAKTDRFCGTNLFKATPHPSAIQKQDKPNSDIDVSFVTSSSTDEKLSKLDVNGELKLSFLAGMVELGGSAKYLSEKKNSFKSVESAAVCKVTTVMEKLDIPRYGDVSGDALKHKTATHVVEQINWGANCTIIVTDRNSDNNEKKEVNGWLQANLQKCLSYISPKAEGKLELTEQDRKIWENFSLKIFGDVLPEEVPTTVDGAKEMMRNLPRLIQNSNDGKGIPLVYVMFPLSSLALPNNLKIKPIKKIDKGQIIKCIRTYDHITELIQKAHDQVDEMNNRSYCVAGSELSEACYIAETLEAQEGSFRSKLEEVIIAVRSGNNSSAITDLCTKNREEAKETFEKCEKIFNAAISRITFAKHCEEFGANHFKPPADAHIAKACCDFENVYVLFHNKGYSDRVQPYQSEFMKLASDSKNDKKTACLVTWCEQSEDSIRIECHNKGKLLYNDVTKKPQAKDSSGYFQRIVSTICVVM